jgi:hypothetical protein
MSRSVWTGKIVNECADTSLTVWKGVGRGSVGQGRRLMGVE